MRKWLGELIGHPLDATYECKRFGHRWQLTTYQIFGSWPWWEGHTAWETKRCIRCGLEQTIFGSEQEYMDGHRLELEAQTHCVDGSHTLRGPVQAPWGEWMFRCIFCGASKRA